MEMIATPKITVLVRSDGRGAGEGCFLLMWTPCHMRVHFPPNKDLPSSRMIDTRIGRLLSAGGLVRVSGV